MIVRFVGILLGGTLAVLGALGVLWSKLPEHPAAVAGRGLLEALAGLAGPELGEGLEGVLVGTLAQLVLFGLAAALILFSLWPSSGGKQVEGQEPAPDGGHPPLDKRLARKVEKQAARFARKGQLADAAELCFQSGLLDRAADYFEQAGDFVRAAELHHDQNRFERSAELYVKAGQHEMAGTIFGAQNQPRRAAECYLKVNRVSVAAEMFERAGDHREAGDCYVRAGFPRHAAQAFLRAEEWLRAAEALEQHIAEEGGRTLNDPGKEKEFRRMVLQAGTLYDRAGQLEAAQRVLERGQCPSAAAEIALRLERPGRAAELFLEGGEPQRAAEALRDMGEEQAAARVLGEYHRDRGDDHEAARCFVEAGEYLSAGDLYRQLEDYGRAAECYEREGDSAQAAEMFRLAGDHERAAACHERCSQFLEAAECYEALGDAGRQAAILDRAGRHLKAGELYHAEGMDDEAIKVLQKVDAGSSEFGDASAILGDIFHAKGQHSLAITKLKQAIGEADLTRENVAAFYRLATVYEANSDFREAVGLYEKILAFDYHYQDVEKRLTQARPKVQEAASHDPSVTSGSASMTPPVARSGRYRIEGELGRGGMGIVYKAEDTVLDRVVAFKVLPQAFQENPQALRNFLREAKSAAKLNHPNIVTVYDAGEQDGRYYIAMEYVDGTTLKEILRRRGAISASGVLHVLLQMCEALGYAHERRVVHRDIKTANTMWTREKKAKIMDFGLAKVVEEVRNHTTLISGTPYYMSPEQTLGRNIDHRTDIYSLGVTLFELATGTLPFKEGNVPYHHVHTPAPDPRSANPKLPPILVQVIQRCLQKDPAARYQSTSEIVAEVKAALAQGGSAG